MIKDNQQNLNRLRIVLDLLILILAYLVTCFLFFNVFPQNSFFGGRISIKIGKSGYRYATSYILPLNLIMYALFRLYRPMRITGRRLELFKVFCANILTILLIAVVFWLFVPDYATGFSRMFLFEYAFFGTVLVVLERNILRMVLVAIRKKGYNQHHILIVGYSDASQAFLRRVKANPRWGYHVFGILDDLNETGTSYRGFEVIGKIGDLQNILETNDIDEVFLALPLKAYDKFEGIVNVCEKAGIQTKFIPDYGRLMSNHPYTEDLMGLPIVYIRRIPLDDMVNAFLKRAMDLFGSLFAIILFLPVMLILAVAIPIASPGPLLYKQERVGRHNKNFMMYKFRSMKIQKETDEKKEWTTKDDPRVTKIGKFIRKTSLDELPQLFNVLKGEMSLIGPRPERPQFVEKFREEIPRYMVKHQVRPGMTGWAQVNGLRGDTSIQKRIDYDLYYIENWSFGFDWKILFLTFFKGFVNKNAY